MKLILGFFMFLFSLICFNSLCFAIDSFENDSKYTTSKDQVVGDNDIQDGNVLGQGISNIGDKTTGIIQDKIESSEDAKQKTTTFIKKLINYFLGIVSLIALIYLLYHGFLTVTAGGKDDQYKKGIAGIKHSAIALFGLGVSWFIVSFVFSLISKSILGH